MASCKARRPGFGPGLSKYFSAPRVQGGWEKSRESKLDHWQHIKKNYIRCDVWGIGGFTNLRLWPI